MEWNNINNDERGSSVRAKLNSILTALVSGSQGVLKIWDTITSLHTKDDELTQTINTNKQDATKGIQEVRTYVDRRVAGLEEATALNKGFYDTESSLKQTWPLAEYGNIAYVGLNFPYALYKWGEDGWYDTGRTFDQEKLGSIITKITYEELLKLRNTSGLKPGQFYQIIDYETTTSQSFTRSEGNLFDLIVFPTSDKSLSERAFAIRSATRDSGYFDYQNLSAWQIWYCLDNDKSRFGWADTSKGKGVIYRMIDEYGNECPYDFKNITYTYEDKQVYTFCFISNNGCVDLTVRSTICRNNVVRPWFKEGVFRLNGNFILTNSTKIAPHDNLFKEGCYGNIAKGYGQFYYNTFGAGCFDNTFLGSFYSNRIGPDCRRNTFGADFRFNILEGYCRDMVFPMWCRNIRVGLGCQASLTNDETASSENSVQNYFISGGISQNLQVKRGLTSNFTITKNSEGVVKHFCIADLIY